MTDFKHIYSHQAELYEALVAREDYQGNILRALQEIRSLDGIEAIELGAGTGRLTCLLAPRVKSIQAFDNSRHMLDVAVAKLRAGGWHNWQADVADNRALPVNDEIADLSIAGWSLGHSVGWYPDSWRGEIEKAVAQMKRVLKPGGTAVILETLGTGRETPQAPTTGLADYYAFLENNLGFGAKWIRTDYRFESLAQADSLTRFFFGDELADRVVQKASVMLPECTGIWWWQRIG